MILTRSVHSPVRQRDGLRILATRFRGRYLPTDRYDVWMANLAPSEDLLRQGQAGEITWTVFARRYRGELAEGGTIDARNHTIRNHGQKFTLRLLRQLGGAGNVTLLCHCAEDEPHCHRHLLREAIEAA